MAARLGDKAWRDLIAKHHAIVRRELARYHGRELDTAGDGFFAVFDGPARAVQAAAAIREPLREIGLEVRAGLHTASSRSATARSSASACRSAPASRRSQGPARCWCRARSRTWSPAQACGSRIAASIELKGIANRGGCWR